MISGQETSRFAAPRLRLGQRRRASRRRKALYTVTAAAEFNLEKFADVDNLHAAFQILKHEGGPGAGIDRLTFDDFSPSEIFDALRLVSKAILSKRYTPYPTRSEQIPKGDGRFRELRLHRITDRTVAKALQLALDSYWRTQLPRLGRGVLHIFAEMQRYMRANKAYVLAIDDVRDCFPSAVLDHVMHCHRRRISQRDLLWLIEKILRGHEGLFHQIGLYQGSPYSPVAMESLLHDCLDMVLETLCPGYPLLLRFVDNLPFACKTESDGHAILRTTEDILARVGLTLKGKDGAPQDIRDPEYNTRVLGLIPRWQEGALEFQIPESSYEDLVEGFHNAINHPTPSIIAKKVIKGWMEAVGPALTKKATPEVIDRILLITRTSGFAGTPSRELQTIASLARGRWIEMAQSPASGGTNTGRITTCHRRRA